MNFNQCRHSMIGSKELQESSFVFITATTKCTKSILYCYKYKKYQSYLLLLQLQEVKGKSNIQEIIRHRLYLTIIMNVYINGPLWLPRQQDYIFDRSLQQAKMYFLFSNRHREENRGLNHYEFPGQLHVMSMEKTQNM